MMHDVVGTVLGIAAVVVLLAVLIGGWELLDRWARPDFYDEDDGWDCCDRGGCVHEEWR